MQRLAVFDIDGTLTDTNSVDDECYVQAVAETLGLDAQILDWSGAPHITDGGLLRWLAERCGHTLDPAEEPAVVRRFVELLRHHLGSTPDRFRPIAGAAEIRVALESRGWRVAVATGGWAESARLKLATIGFDVTGLAMATANDGLTRTEIVQLALERATAMHGTFDRVVSIGDAVWDVRTAAAVGWPFVGIASGDRAERLRASGAATILPDLADLSAVHNALDTAGVPRAAITPR